MAPPPPEIASETILLVLLTTWRCLVAALPLQQDVFVLNVCDWLGLHSPYPIWLYKVSGPRRFNNPLLPEHDHLYDAMVAFCLCEVFCSFMFPHVERLLSPYGTLVLWTQYIPNPALLLIRNLEDIEPIFHNAILLKCADGKYLFLDDTEQQFGRNGSTTPAQTVLAERVAGPKRIRAVPPKEQAVVYTATNMLEPNIDDGFWIVARPRFNNFLQNFDWTRIVGMSTEEVKDHVELLAGAAFQGTYKEAQPSFVG